jgi:hypothetical protein
MTALKKCPKINNRSKGFCSFLANCEKHPDTIAREKWGITRLRVIVHVKKHQQCRFPKSTI